MILSGILQTSLGGFTVIRGVAPLGYSVKRHFRSKADAAA